MSPAVRIVIAQAGIGTLCSVAFFFVSISAGTSALMALSCVLLPTMYFAWLQAHTLNAVRVLLHGVLKMLLTLTMVGVCIAVIGIEPLGFFLTFALMQLSYGLQQLVKF